MGIKIDDKKWNILMFIISYTINNIVSGIAYDVYINYLQDTSESLAKSFWSYYGYSAFIGAFFLLFVSKIGYKKIVIFCVLSCSLTLIVAPYFRMSCVFYIFTLLILTGIQLHFSILSPYVAAYTDLSNKIKWFSRTFYIGYIGFFLSTYLGGFFVVKIFADYIQKDFHTAKMLTTAVAEMEVSMKVLYIASMERVLVITGIISLLALIPAFLIREKKEDYSFAENKVQNKFKDSIQLIFKEVLKKDTVIYMIYWGLTNFGMGLFTSYYTVFLNRVLYIDKATSSLMVSISYVAMVVFMFFTDRCVNKFGQVVTLAGTSFLAIPFMLIIAQGDRFGSDMVYVVGFALFMRAGLMNLSSPIDSSFSMELVDSDLRSIFASLINFIAGMTSILSGYFTGGYLFSKLEGYREAYYIAAAIYSTAGLIFFLSFRKYNRTLAEDKGEEE